MIILVTIMIGLLYIALPERQWKKETPFQAELLVVHLVGLGLFLFYFVLFFTLSRNINRSTDLYELMGYG